ncbi:Nuclear receptor coactivator 5, partial [Stegodyphus mimosarum]
MRDRSPMRGPDDRFSDRLKRDDGYPSRDDIRRKESGRPFYEDSPRDRFMGMEGRPRLEGPRGYNSRYDGPVDQFKPSSFPDSPMSYPSAPPKCFYNEGFPKPNECEIIAVNKSQRAYAESVEARVKNLGILVDILFLKDEALLTQTIDDIARRGSLYAMVINPQNEQHRSVTVNILHGTPQEHRNMPLEDALKLLSRNFHEHIRLQKEHMERERAERGPYVGVVSADREIQFLLRMLADGRWISLSEINTVIRYLCERRDKMQGGPDERAHGRLPIPSADLKLEPSFKPKDDPDVAQKEQDLQNRIINIMNQGAPPAIGLGNTQAGGLNQGLMPNIDMPTNRSNQPRMSPGINNMRPPSGVGSTMPGMKSGRPGHSSVDENVTNQTSLESSTSASESTNQPVFTSAVSGPNLPSDPATTATYINFDNPSVQKALDNLMQSGPNLLKSISLSSSNMPGSQNTLSGSASKTSAGSGSGMGPPADLMGGKFNMPPPRGPGGMSEMGGNILPRGSGNVDMGPPRGGGGMGMPGPQRGPGNSSDMMGPQRGGFGGMSDMGNMNPQGSFGGGGMGDSSMGQQRMPDMGRMGSQRGSNMGLPQRQDMGLGMGPGGNFHGQDQFNKYQGPGQQGNFPGSYNSGPNMGNLSRQNFGNTQGMGGMGGGPRRY